MRWLVCFLVLVGWMCASADELQTSILRHFTPPLLDCLAQRKVFYSANGTCHSLPDVTACPEGQWLVLDEDRINTPDQFEPLCKKIMCTEPQHVFWPEDNTCHKLLDRKTLCKPGNVLTNDKYGNGMCDCNKLSVHLPLNLSVNATECYELYSKGSCPDRQVPVARHINNMGHIAECKPDPCVDKNRRSRKTFAQDGEDRKCYPLNEQGPCPLQSIFQVSQSTYAPNCVARKNYSIFKFALRCTRDDDGNCKSESKIAQETKESEAFSIMHTKPRKQAVRK